MMLYIFYVDTGTMKTFDMDLAFKSVKDLKLHLEEECKIPVDKQVLLINGGQCMDPEKSVCSYSGGTDTNPIFLFSKSVIESSSPPASSGEPQPNYELIEKAKELCEWPASFKTIEKRVGLAQQMLDDGRDQYKRCEELVLDQHLQQQGWSAVVANLEDIVVDFRKRSELFEKSYRGYINDRSSYLGYLKNFEKDLRVLEQIPMLPPLLENANLELEMSESQDKEVETSEENKASTSEEKQPQTLFQWISACDEKNSMDNLYEHCEKGLESFDERLLTNLKKDVDATIENACDVTMREIKGLSDRLSGLESLMRKAKKSVEDQNGLAQSFIKNHREANNLNDASILPDLCATHKRQLAVMSANHSSLCDIKRRCVNSKEELSNNLYHRLRWVMFVENKILEIDQKMVMYHESLRRLKRNLEVLQQIHITPAIYLSAVAEVVRRRAFSQSFLLWASELACHLLTIHNEEVTKRKEFNSGIEGHFLTTIFPGMDDLPPAFATQAPSTFDSGLPKITQEDLERLKIELPEFAENLNIPDTSAMTNLFLSRSIVRTETEKIDEARAIEDTLVQVVSEVGLGSNLDHNLLTTSEPCTSTAGPALAHLRDVDKGCESETDTEEFEQVGQSPLELNFVQGIPSSRPGTQDVATSIEDNLQISRSDHNKLKSILYTMATLAKETLAQLRSELNDLRVHLVSETESIRKCYRTMSESYENLVIQTVFHEQEIKQIYELKLEEIRQKEIDQSSSIEQLTNQRLELESENRKLLEEVSILQDDLKEMQERHKEAVEQLLHKICTMDVEKDRRVKEVTEGLTASHKNEIESIRSRFKLMTMERMERSPSDNSLEKIGDLVSLPHHETIILQMTENFELEKEKAVQEAILKEGEKWEKTLNETVETKVEDAVKKVTQEKDEQLQGVLERETNLSRECVKFKGTILQLTEESEAHTSELLDKINNLQKDKDHLEEKLEQIESEKSDLTTSVAIYDGKIGEPSSSSSPKQKDKDVMSKSETTTVINSNKLTLDSCKEGDQVVVLWDGVHESFRIIQENTKYSYFLHSDSLELLKLEVIEGKPNKLYCTGLVVSKEFCHARKPVNRYKVQRGTKFFRVLVKPLHMTQFPIPSTSSGGTGGAACLDVSFDSASTASSDGQAVHTCLALDLVNEPWTESEIDTRIIPQMSASWC